MTPQTLVGKDRLLNAVQNHFCHGALTLRTLATGLMVEGFGKAAQIFL
ncbi:hypothetical protein [Paracoccus sp. R86501]